jgi:hypothetical protein
MIIAAKISDRFGNRGWPTQFGWVLLIVGFAIFLGAPTSNKPAHFVALILAETGHYSMRSHSALRMNAFLTSASSLHSPYRHLVCQQRWQRVSSCRRRTSCRRSRASCRYWLRIPLPQVGGPSLHARSSCRGWPVDCRLALHLCVHGLNQVGERPP